MKNTRSPCDSFGAHVYRWPTITVVGLVLTALMASAAAQDSPAQRSALRVCQDPNNLPFSNVKGE
ncbi:MAG: hypothetical protein NTY41_14880, partial [Proteobacteria bacterium]|nr:hypothetical protein [Pseudomonadota bacterium]